MNRLFILILLFFVVACSESDESVEATETLPNAPVATEKTPKEIRQEAVRVLENAQAAADSIKISSFTDAEKMIQIHREDAQFIADSLISTAEDSASTILADANNKAEEIASKAKARQEFLDKNSLLLLSIFALLTISGLSYFIFTIWTWRKEYDQGAVILPEQMSDYLKEISKSISELFDSTSELFEVVHKEGSAAQHNEEIQKRVQRILKGIKIMGQSINDNSKEHSTKYEEALEPLRRTIDTQKQEIDRLKEGYDSKIKQKLILKLISMKEQIEKYVHSGSKDVQEAMERILEPINFIFEQEGVSSFSFETGEKIDTQAIEVVERISTDDTLKVGSIHKTIRLGYLLKGQDDDLVLRKAKVAVYVEKKKG